MNLDFRQCGHIFRQGGLAFKQGGLDFQLGGLGFRQDGLFVLVESTKLNAMPREAIFDFLKCIDLRMFLLLQQQQ